MRPSPFRDGTVLVHSSALRVRGTSMPKNTFRIFATADIGEAAFKRLRERGYEIAAYSTSEPPPKRLIIEKARSGIDGLIATLRDPIDADIFEAGNSSLKMVAQYTVRFDN